MSMIDLTNSMNKMNKSIELDKFDEDKIKQISQDIITNKYDYWISELLDSSERYLIHNYIEKTKEFDSLTTRTICVEGISGKKKVMIEKKPITNSNTNNVVKELDCSINNLKLNSEQIDLFIKYSKLPIPINLESHIDYYVNLLNSYYNTQLYKYFVSDIEKLGLNKIKLDIPHVKNKIINYLKSSQLYQDFLTSSTNHPTYPKDFITPTRTIYNQNHLGKNLLSIDIKSANWTCYKKITKLDMNYNWSELVLSYTPSKFIAESKYLREVIFGDLGSKKLMKFVGEFLFELDNVIKLDTNFDKITCLNDEIIYEIKDINTFNFNQFVEKINKINPHFDQIYRVEQFKLKRIAPYEYYIKEISSTNSQIQTKRVQIKQVPKHFVPQVIKYYQNEEPNNFDLKFMFENIPCTFDSKLRFENII